MKSSAVRIAVLGGSGLYDMREMGRIEELQLDTPFGAPSAAIVIGSLGGVRVAFLARHGRGHVHTPTTVPYRANIYALKRLGVECIISVSACGSLREDYSPGHVVVPDQLYDNTKSDRGRSFFGHGLVAHAGVARPFCARLSRVLVESVQSSGGVVHAGGAFVTIEGPRFSTRAESEVFRSWGMSIVGMTTCPEAFLAREAEMCYAVMAHVTDYDVWHESEQPVSVDQVVKILASNLELARRSIASAVARLAAEERSCACSQALATAILTDRASISREARSRLEPIVGKYLDPRGVDEGSPHDA
ncbi:MAG: S-methyl-5'-thioadenosine phosphorylase [Planctomycetota bacterium]